MADTDPIPAADATVPAVVAVVVTHDPGPWLEECLTALGEQDYPNLSVLILDAGSKEDPTRRIADVLPSAYVRRLGRNPGYGAATNDVLEVVEGASHLLLCHDDIAPDPDVVRLLVEEAFRSNAGMVAPKLVDWRDPGVLLKVGMSADKMGMPVPLVERGELDQEQHDAVRDVFCAPSGCVLVRADLFKSLGGFDPAMLFCGEDVDLSWRAQIAGARVLVAPAARVRHREAAQEGLRLPPGVKSTRDLDVLLLRHAMRAALKSYGPLHRLRVMPQAIVVSVFRMIAALVTGRPRAASGVLAAWRWNATKQNRSSLKTARRAVRATRSIPDSEARRLQSRGTAGLTNFAREHHLTGDDQGRFVEAANRGMSAAIRPSATAVVTTLIALVVAFGSRSLWNGQLAAIGEQLPMPESPFAMLRLYGTAWRVVGLGGEGASPPAFALLGVAGSLLLGAMGLLQKLLVLGMLPLGLVGAFRLASRLESTKARATVLITYAAIPVPWNALSAGRWSGLVTWAVVPWVFAGLVRVAEGELPARRMLLGAGIGLAVAGAFAPAVLPVAVVGTIGLWAGSALVGSDELLPFRTVRAGLGAALLGAALLLPWSLSTFLAPPPPVGGFAFDELLRFQTGPWGGPPAGWAWLAAAALPLVIGRSWRLKWAAASWGAAIAGWLLAWAVSRGWVPIPMRSPEPALALSAIALAFAAGLGVLAFELDLPAYRFGWRQIAPPAAALAIVLGALPIFGGAFGGRWDQPERDLGGSLAFVTEGARLEQGDFRILWLGDAAAVPGHPWKMSGFPGTSYSLSRDGGLEATEMWPGPPPGATERVPEAFSLASGQATTQLGRMLAPMGIRYVAVARRPAPEAKRAPVSAELVTILDRQVDLGRIETEDAVILFENAAWIPSRAELPGGTLVEGGLIGAASADLSGSASVLPEGNEQVPTKFSGAVEVGTRILLAESPSAGWRLRGEGGGAPREAAFGVANAWDIEAGGAATLSYRSPIWQWGICAAQIAAWFLAARWVWQTTRARRAERRATAKAAA
ncbi:MAG TPA: glycosyltransferase family 2 protein [Acidimicrobiales bacterium]|nr:glycosyltransferase family 2 protein [Acidimicrobiales bacterium]